MNIPNMYGNKDFHMNNESISINNDIIGTAFIFLSRLEELNSNHDKLNRYQYENSLADRFDIIARPIVNEYIEFLKDAISFLDSKIIFKKYSFDVMLTHDIDLIKRWTIKHLLKHSIVNIGKKNYLNGFKEFMESRRNNKKDPYYNFDQIIELSNSYNISSLFLFMCLEKDEFEFLYSLNEVEEPINNILKSKNHKLGIHPSKITYNNHEYSKREINRLSKKIKRKIEYSRQHYLMFDVKKTWNILNANDIKYDLIGSSNLLDEARSISENKSDYGLLFIDNFDTKKTTFQLVFILKQLVFSRFPIAFKSKKTNFPIASVRAFLEISVVTIPI